MNLCIYLFQRCVTTCLMVMLSEFFPSYRVVFQFLISLDISSHWLHMYRYSPKRQFCCAFTALFCLVCLFNCGRFAYWNLLFTKGFSSSWLPAFIPWQNCKPAYFFFSQVYLNRCSVSLAISVHAWAGTYIYFIRWSLNVVTTDTVYKSQDRSFGHNNSADLFLFF